MADGFIQGESISGSEEKICPGEIWEPEQPDTRGKKILFTELVKVVSDPSKEAIIQSGGFKGNRKLYNRNQEGTGMYARFSWWSVHIPPGEKERLQNDLLEGEELADLYLPGSRYGTNVFHLDLGQLLSAYEKCCGRQPEIRVLGTFVYKREVMHAFVVLPTGNEKFSDHHLVAQYKGDYNQQVPVRVGNRTDYEMHHPFEIHYSWKPFSVIKWNGINRETKQWAHQAFAFFLDPLPDEIMVVREAEQEANWEPCTQSGIKLVASFKNE